MRTPILWTKNLENKYISEDMLGAALYSVNKRAKNCRDQKKRYRDSYYGTDKKYQDKENEYYQIKNELLKAVQPVCIHREHLSYEKVRYYDFEKHFEDTLMRCLCAGTIVWSNSYYKRSENFGYEWDYDYDEGKQVFFFDEILPEHPVIRYYLYYVIGGYSYHHPIEEQQVVKYSELPVVDIDRICTNGKEVTDLYSIPFVKKVMAVLKDPECKVETNLNRELWLENFYPEDYPQKRGLSDKEIDNNISNALCMWEDYLTTVIKKQIRKKVGTNETDIIPIDCDKIAKSIMKDETERCEQLWKNKCKGIEASFKPLDKFIREAIAGTKLPKKFMKRLGKLERKISNIQIEAPQLVDGDDALRTMLELDDGTYINANFRTVSDFVDAYLEIVDEYYKGLTLSQIFAIKKETYARYQETMHDMTDKKYASRLKRLKEKALELINTYMV